MENWYEQIFKLYDNNKLGHAFLIETDSYDETYSKVLEIIKYINCPKNNYSSNCGDECSICFQIENNKFLDLMVIEPFGQNINKVQILDLKKKFSKSPLFGKYNCYIIKEAEKLNASSANTMLKFLENPNGQVVGFFLTNHKENVIPTILSRCQVYKDISHVKINLDESEKSFYFSLLYEYIGKFESEKSGALIYNKNFIINNLKEKEKIESFFIQMLNVYKNIYDNFKFDKNLAKELEKFNNIINKENMIKKIKVIEKTIEKIQYNVNIELLLDKFVVEMGNL